MPSGYTADVGEKGISFREYALKCARAMGYLAEMRDESMDVEIPTEFKPDNYYLEQIQRAKKTLLSLQNMSDTEVLSETERLYDESLQEYVDSLNSKATVALRYVEMRSKAKEWKAPTPEHKSLRDFMISQLEESLSFDCSVHHLEVPKRREPLEYKKREINSVKKEINYWEEEYKKEVQLAKEKTEWITQLINSLPKEQ